MTTKVNCGQCQHFKPHQDYSEFGDNGHCKKWNEQLAKKESIYANSRFYAFELSGKPFNNEITRECKQFTGDYVFVTGD